MVTSLTAAENTDTDILDYKEYWKTNAFYPVLDTIICQMKERFSEESLQIATSIDNLLKLNFEGCTLLIDQYKVI